MNTPRLDGKLPLLKSCVKFDDKFAMCCEFLSGDLMLGKCISVLLYFSFLENSSHCLTFDKLFLAQKNKFRRFKDAKKEIIRQR